MKHVEIEVFLIAKTQLQEGTTEKWLASKGVSAERNAAIIDFRKSSAERVVEVAGRRCYMSFEVGMNPNVSKIREDAKVYIDNILASGHGSVLEHVTFTFAIENVSRVFTGEMNRHRAGMAISEGSMRFIRYTDIPYWVPTSIRTNPSDSVELDQKKRKTQDLFDKAFSDIEAVYTQLLDVWKDEMAPESKFKAKKEITSMMRRIIPMGVATGGIWTGNIRALRHIFEMRCSAAAEEEILLVGTKMLNTMRESEPTFFGDFKTDPETGLSEPKYSKV